MKACLLIPHYDHAAAIGAVLQKLDRYGLPCIVVDDGSDDAARAVLREHESRYPWLSVVYRPVNGGQGAALCTGYRHAAAEGYTHTLELDADGQHETDDVPRFLDAMEANPDALVLGVPIFADDIPKHRLWGRQLSRGLVWAACASTAIRDPLCGFRGVPLARALALLDSERLGERMNFHPEFAVRMFRGGAAIVSVPTRVCYPPGGVSHFDMVADNRRLASTYVQLLSELPGLALRRLGGEQASAAAGEAGTGADTTPSWGKIPERGSMAWLWLMAAIYRTLGRRACLLLLYPIAAYFTLVATTARRASRSYLETLWATPEGRRALGRPPSLAATFRHLHEFSINIFDRFVAWHGDLDDIRFEHVGSQMLVPLAASGRGGILMGAHQGSFDMMRLLADKHELTVNVLMFTKHAARINNFFEKLDPNSRVRVVEISPGAAQTAFVIKQCIERGEFVGILADRIHPGGRDRPVYVNFLGRRTAFPLTPFLLATLLGCPLVACACIRLDDATYESSARLLSDGFYPRRGRAQKAQELLEAYVAELERTCYRSPYQWFNFFDYWGDREGGDA